MKISSDEITSVIKKQIENYKVDLNVDEVGTVLEVGDGIAHVYGLQNCMAGELLELPNGVYGMALNLEESNVGAVLLGRSETIKEGDVVKRTGSPDAGSGRRCSYRTRSKRARTANRRQRRNQNRRISRH